MKYLALATDYDGTIACDGTVDDDTAFALQDARSAGLSLILVTGRELADLFKTFPHAKLFDRIVAENGAVLYDPAEQTIQSLAPPAAPALVSALQRARIPLSVGHSIVATVIPHEHDRVQRDSRSRPRLARDLQQGMGDGAAGRRLESHRAADRTSVDEQDRRTGRRRRRRRERPGIPSGCVALQWQSRTLSRRFATEPIW